jgi:hypothetical protein
MNQIVRSVGVAVLAAALLNASAGLCFCHRGPAAPGSSPAPHGCCHGQNGSGTLAIQAAGSCCHIEAAQRDVTQTDAVQLAPPQSSAAPVYVSAGLRVSPLVAATLTAPSPPPHTLRI